VIEVEDGFAGGNTQMNYEGSSRLTDNGWRDVWRSFFDFLARPRLPEHPVPFGRTAISNVGALMALDWSASVCCILAFVAAEKAGVHLPKNVLDVRHPGLPMVMLVALGAPLIEEFLFRLWLRGKPFLIVVALAPWLLGGTLLAASHWGLRGSSAWTVVAACGAAIIMLLVLAWKRRGVPSWYRRIFPIAFWLTTGLFALAHLSNYKASMSTLLLLMVVPQFIGGMIMGYARVRYGMWANLSLHIARNSLAMTLVLSSGA
jgi:Type II CAAX prenyl endopeptidase Rce1-like